MGYSGYSRDIIEQLKANEVTPESLNKFLVANAMSYTTLARILGVQTRTVSNWMANKNMPPDFLGLALNELQRRINMKRQESGF